VKKMDYYAVQNPWRMPKWVGFTLGGIFAVIVIGSMVTIVQLTKSAAPPPVAAVAAAPVLQAPATAPVAAAATAPVASDDAAPADKHARASKKHAAHGKKGKLMASAKHAPVSTMGAAQRQTILAKHDSKSKRSEKDALDKLLGL
jgi:hypothetical protein